MTSPSHFRSFRSFRPAALLFSALGPLAALAAAAEAQIAGRPISAIATSQITTPATSYWAGEIFPLTHETRIERRYFTSVASEFEWSPPGVVLEDWSAPERYANGNAEVVATQSRAYVRGTGTVQLPGAPQNVRLVTSFNGDRSTNSDTFTLQATGPRLTVRPLPTPTPAAYANAVGDFTIKSTLSTLQAKVGDSVTWTLELSGAGNWPEITKLPGRVVSKDFNAVAPVLKRNLKAGSLFDGALTEDVLLVPTKAGEYQLGPIRYTYFDPKRGKYQMLVSETYTLVVSARGTLDPIATTTDRYRPVNSARTPIPSSPQPLPLDPLGPGWSSLAPLTPATETIALTLTAGLVFVCWLGLAAARSRITDTLAPRRRARAQLVTILDQLDRGTLAPEETRRLMFAWQDATIAFSGLHLTTPSSTQIAQAIEGHGAVGSSWAPLWRESNAALYGEHALLAPGWVMRAKAALSERDLPPVPFGALFLPRNLLPFIPKFARPVSTAPVSILHRPASPLSTTLASAAPTLLAVLTTITALGLAAVLAFAPTRADASDNEASTPSPVTAAAAAAAVAKAIPADPMAAYQKGDFAGAEAAWRRAAAAAPLDASAHYNLALVAAQLNRWPESMAQSLAAFCLNPSDPAVRFQFEMAIDRAGIDNPLLTPFLKGSLRHRIAGRLSPGQWGVALILTAILSAALLCGLLVALYKQKGLGLRYTTGALALLAVAATFTAHSSIRCYGPLADEQIAVVARNTLLCSVPTEIDTTQKTVPLPAGTLGKVDKTFLGWSRLYFPNGQTGWIRTDAVVQLYR